MTNKPALDFTVVNEKRFVDIPSSAPANPLRLSRVGITNRPITLTLADPFMNGTLTLPSRITVFSSLHASQRGLHMSRFEEAFDELRTAGLSQQEFVTTLAEIVLKTQQQDQCEITLESDIEHRVTKNPSGKSSVELITIHSSVQKSPGETAVTIGVSVPFINACPCTQRWGMRQFYNTLTERGYEASEAEELVKCAPLQAHTNRGTARLTLGSSQTAHHHIYNALDRSVPIIRELLKGPDEHSVVSAAHGAGQFCEDNIRAILTEVLRTFGTELPAGTSVAVDVDVDESVHFHNLSASYCGTLAELAALQS